MSLRAELSKLPVFENGDYDFTHNGWTVRVFNRGDNRHIVVGFRGGDIKTYYMVEEEGVIPCPLVHKEFTITPPNDIRTDNTGYTVASQKVREKIDELVAGYPESLLAFNSAVDTEA